MTLSILDPGIFNTAVPFYFFYTNEIPSGLRPSTITNIDVSKMTDAVEKDPIFDTAHAIVRNLPIAGAQLTTDGDNRNNSDTMQLDPDLHHKWEYGHTTTHETSQGLTVGITQAFTYSIGGVGGSTTLSAEGSFSWTQGSSNTDTQSTTLGGNYPFAVPPHQYNQQVVSFNQDLASVPYAVAIRVDGNADYTWNNPRGYRDLTVAAEYIFNAVNAGGGGPNNVGPITPYKDVNWADFSGGPNGSGIYSLHGELELNGNATQTINKYNITLEPITPVTHTVQSEYDPAVPIGVHRFLDDNGREVLDTPFNDWIDGGAGNDVIRFTSGEEIAYAGAGNDRIIAVGVGRSLLDGGEGNDVIRLTSAAAFGMVLGGDGNDRIRVDAPAAMLYGGAGNDRYWLNGATAGGTVINDTEGRNRLEIDNGGVPLGFERLPHGDDLYILLGGGNTYDRMRDVVWADFFANPLNGIDGRTTAEIADETVTFRLLPAQPLQPTPAQFINAANAAYSSTSDKLPADLSPFTADGRHLALEITDDGFYGTAFITPDDQVIVAFEGTNLSALDDEPIFVAAQIAADVEIRLGLVPDAYGDALAFTNTVLAAAASQGIGAEDVFITGHSLGAAEAQYVAAQLGLAGQTYGGPGIAASTIPADATSRLVNYVEYGDPIGNYSANPNLLNGFLFSDDILRFGTPVYIGDPLARVALEDAGALFGPGTTREQNAEGLAAIATLESQYHPLTTHAGDLGVVLADPDVAPPAPLSSLGALGFAFV
ncbi:ETX/MTX2 family pore-forming toxin [Belnapia sp. T6]|uniref:ETX/MTX2 family pore-forming toxin n=1 Tax=Belnapia mucosa TaxID=2804532 RepID=A0ABS1V6Z1_9PROT|nr:ETX/MTX2 family pore-forming toxin [Belnapia mucosa]MBL6457435.1 ETX/MTX2 family pore-forming toxin [Belnapia mucosa]